jgi:hypothetical protein
VKLGAALFMLFMASSVVACATGDPADDSSGGGSDGAGGSGGKKKSAGTGAAGGAGEGAAPLPGCSANASCSDRATDGSFCRPVCDVACQKTHAHYSFWVSVFEVANTGGLGRHQGIAILGAEMSIDERFKLADRPDLAQQHGWPQTVLPELPPDMAQTMTDAGRFAPFAMCDAPKIVLDQPLFNHGRTLLRDPAHAANRLEMRSAHGDGDPGAAENAALAGTRAWSAQVKACLGGVKDGQCDAVCGNCSYVLPPAGLDPMRGGDWSKPSSLVAGSGKCSDESSYYGGPNQETRDSFLGNPYPNPFTHCAKQGCGTNDETPTISGLWWSSDAVVSGRYGHNSNADAEAEYRAFSGCVAGEFDTTEMCRACGDPMQPNHQDPCGARTNTAATWWDRTANLMKDFTPAIEGDVGERSTQPPKCAWADFVVSGM